MEGKVNMGKRKKIKGHYGCYENLKTKLKSQKYVIVEIINNIKSPIFLKGGILVYPGTINSRFETKLQSWPKYVRQTVVFL